MDVTNVVKTLLTVVDKASGPMMQVAQTATRLNSTFDRVSMGLTHLMGIGGGIGAALSFKGALESSERYMKHVKEINELTGATAEEADTMLSSARKAGIEYGTMQRIMFQLSRRGAALEQSMAGIPGSAANSQKRYKRLGVDISKGPVEAIISMSKAYKKGMLDQGALMNQFRIPADVVNDFAEFLDQGPEAIKSAMAAAKKSGSAVTTANLLAFVQIEKAQHKIHDGLNRMKLMVGKEVMPAIVSLLNKFEENLPRWIEGAKAFGKFLNENLDKAISLAQKLGKVMLANAAIQTITGGKMGMGGLMVESVKKAPSVGKALVEGIAKYLPALGVLGIKAGGAAAGVTAGAGGSMAAATVVAKFTGALAIALPVVAAVAALIALLVAGFKGFQKNLGGIRDRIVDLWDTMKARVELLFEPIAAIWRKVSSLVSSVGEIFGIKGSATEFFQRIAPEAIYALMRIWDAQIFAVQVIETYFGHIFELIKWGWGEFKDYVSNAWGKIKDAFVYNFVDPVMGAWEVLSQAVSAYIVKPAVRAWGAVSQAFLDYVIQPIIISWEFISKAFVDYIVNPIMSAWKIVSQAFLDYIAKPIIKAWGVISDVLHTYFIDPFVSAMRWVYDSILAPMLRWTGKKLAPVTSLVKEAATVALEPGQVANTLGALWESFKDPYGSLVAGPLDLLKKSIDEVSRATAERVKQDRATRALVGRKEAEETAKTKRKEQLFDFRGSRFDITQNFAEGFDPDRIAVAFSQDLAALGETRVQSGFVPLAALR